MTAIHPSIWHIQEPRPEYTSFLSVRTGKVDAIKTKQQTQKNTPKLDKKTNSNTSIPSITLQGKWLKEAGFEADNTIQIEVFTHQLLITREKNQEK